LVGATGFELATPDSYVVPKFKALEVSGLKKQQDQLSF
jgi:hypothetical protein